MQRHARVIVATAVLVVLAGAGIAVKFSRKGLPEIPKPEDFIARPQRFVTDIKRSEDFNDAVNKAIKSTFVKGLRESNPALAGKGMTADFLARFPSPADGKEVPDGSLGIREYANLPLKDMGAEPFLALIRSHVEGWVQVERTTWRPFLCLVDPSEKSAFLELHFQLAGPLPDGRRVDLSCSARAQAVVEGETWKLRRFEWLEGTRIEGRQKPWRDITDAAGLHFNESEGVAKVKQAVIDNRSNTWYGCEVVRDFNGDGFWDILVSVGHQDSVLFMNDGKGGFERVATPIESLADAPSTWLVLDLDGDGVEEWVSSTVNAYGDKKGWFDLYRRKGDGWERLPKAFEFPNPTEERQVGISQIVPVDINRDGLLDLYFCGYSNNRSLRENFNTIASYDGTPNYFFINQGGLKFTEEAEARGIVENQYTYVAKFWDFDFDGDMDLMDGNDYGPNVLWENDGSGHFRRAKDHILAAGSNYTMGISISDYDNTGTWAIHISNMYSHAGNRIVPLASAINEDLRETARVLAQGNQQYEWDPATKAWRECSVERAVNWADWAWGCIFADFDNDMDKDLYVANGFTSNADAAKPDY